jgi:hypothetical protein
LVPVHLEENAKLPEIIWRFQCKYQAWFPTSPISNPHFYPEITSLHLRGDIIGPLSDYDERWTTTITVIGDDSDSRFKLEDSNSFVMYEPVKNLTNSSEDYLFKGISSLSQRTSLTSWPDAKAQLYPPGKIETDLRGADGLDYYFWERVDNSFIKANKVRTVRELVKALNVSRSWGLERRI